MLVKCKRNELDGGLPNLFWVSQSCLLIKFDDEFIDDERCDGSSNNNKIIIWRMKNDMR